MRMRILLTGLVLLPACQDAAPSSQEVTVRDSAGVQIVEHAGDPRSAPIRWRTAAEPVLRVGAIEGDEAYLMDGIIDLALLDDGSFVVANRGDQSLRWFDAMGQFMFERGGPGEGPGEFSRVGQLSVADGDSIVAVDVSAARFTLFGSDGELGRTTRLAGLMAPPASMLRIPSGDWILGAAGSSSSQLGQNIESGIYRPMSPILRVSNDGARFDTLGMFPGTEIQITTTGDGFMMALAPIGRGATSYAVVGNELIVGTKERLQFDVFSTAGSLVRSVRAPDVDLTVTPEIQAAYEVLVQEQLANVPASERASAERRMAAMKLPDVVPAYSSMWTDADGRVWLGSLRIGDSSPQEALVFDVTGTFLGRAELPPSLRIFIIRDGFVWGRERDEFDVEYVVKYALEEVQ